MLKRELIHPETQVKVELCLAHNYIQLTDPSKSAHGTHYDYLSAGKADPEEFFHTHVQRYLTQGYVETEASKSRRVLQVRNGDTPLKYWIIVIDIDLCEVQYGKYPKYGHWIHGGTRKDFDSDTREEALAIYTQQILKKLKEGYTEYYRRENEYTALTDAALATAATKPTTAKTAKKSTPAINPTSSGDTMNSAVKQRYELSEGKSNKFWEIELAGNSHTVNYGRIGTNGQTQIKEFANDAEAKKSHDKLISEKVKKGYQLVSSSDPTPAVTVAPPKPAAKKTAGVSEQPAAKTKSPEATSASSQPNSNVIREVLREIDLNPWEIASVRYRKQGAISRGEPRPFDQKQCCQILGTVQTEQYGWRWRWDLINLPMALTREEAHFWLTAILDNPTRQTPKQVAKDFRNRTFDGNVDFKGLAERLFRRGHHGVDPSIMLPMTALFELSQIVELIRQDPDFSQLPAHQTRYDYRTDVCDGFALYVIPFVEETDLDSIRADVRKEWDPTQTPATYYHSFDGSYYLAAALGMHDESQDVVSRIPDDQYQAKQGEWVDHYQRPQSLIFGLGSAEEMAQEMRRLKLKLRLPRWVRRFLAATEFSALDIVHDTIISETNKEHAANLLDAFTIVHAPEAAESMLDLKLNSKAPAIARDWLSTYVGCAVTGLVETAGGRGKLADAAIQYLREAKALGHADLVEAAVAALPDSDIKAKVTRDVVQHQEKVYQPFDEATTPEWYKQAELDTIATPKVKLPNWALPAVLPPIVVGEHKLNDHQVETIIKLMAKSKLDDPPALIKA